ncbi:unnamed protein product [Auanema sp. JU1783]|nr:unnamed protein product [Auanema sp. JU1783]
MQRRKSGSYGEITLQNIKSCLHRLTVRIDELIFTEHSETIVNALKRGELFGFVLRYKIPTPPNSTNQSLKNEIIVRSVLYNESEIKFKHKKVFSIELNDELIKCWQQNPIHVTLTAEISKTAEKHDAKLQLLCHTTVSFRDLLLSPFKLIKDHSLFSSEFEGLLSICLELGSRTSNVNERLEALRQVSLDNTYTIQKPPRHSRSRSASRCRSCSPQREQKRLNAVSHIPKERFELSPIARSSLSHDVHDEKQYISTSSLSNDSVFVLEPNQNLLNTHESRTLWMNLSLHEAHDLPLVRDESGALVAPRAFIKILSRNEQIQSPVSAPSRNPRWNWSGQFVFSAERGNLVIKMLHSRADGQVESLGMVTLNRPFHDFEKSTFEITILTPQMQGTATVTMSLNVRPYRERAPVENRKERSASEATSRNSYSSSIGKSESETLRWSGSKRNPRLILTTRRSLSSSRSPEPREDTSHLLKENLQQLENLMQSIRHRR